MNTISGLCTVCKTSVSKYVCPRCSIPYCNLTCYKNHSNECTESFSRQHIVDSLSATRSNSQDRKEVENMLLRLHMSNETTLNPEDILTPDNDENDLEEVARLLSNQGLEQGGSINLDDIELSEEQLPKEIRAKFQQAIVSGSIAESLKLMHPPWWQPVTEALSETFVVDHESANQMGRGSGYQDFETGLHWRRCIPHKRVVHAIADDADSIKSDDHDNLYDVDVLTPQNPDVSSLPSLRSLLGKKKQPSDSLPFNLVDILFTYVFVLRSYGGDWSWDNQNAAFSIYTISPVIRAAIIHESISSALIVTMDFALSNDSPLQNSRHFALSVIRHIATILFYKQHILRALNHLQLLFDNTINNNNNNMKIMLQTKRKLLFYLIWVVERNDEDFYLLAEEVSRFWQEQCIQVELDLSYSKQDVKEEYPSAFKMDII